MKIFVCGDIHAYFGRLNDMLNRKNPDIILQCGDYGWWPHYHDTYDTLLHGKKFDQHGVKNPNTKIFWCGGNHENWDDLDKYDDMTEVSPNVFYMPIGTTLELPDGRTVMFVGKAESTDKQWRTEGVSWWRQEVFSYKDFDLLPNPKEVKVDIVISHTVPKTFMKEFSHEFDSMVLQGRINDPTCEALDRVLEMFKPDLWFSGHFHNFMWGVYKNTRWFGLADIPYDKWYLELDLLPNWGEKKFIDWGTEPDLPKVVDYEGKDDF